MRMRSARGCRHRLVLLIACVWWAAPGLAEEVGGAGNAAQLWLGGDVREFLLATRSVPVRDWTALAAGEPGDVHGRRRRPHLDLSPFAREILGFLRRHGLPLNEQRDENGRGPIGVYADVNIGEDLPAVSFHLGDRPIEPLGAFYTAEKGFRCALVWPIDRFTLRVEAGEDSEFGYFGIAGVQWVHPTKPLAAGIGIPMNLRDENGEIGVIFQFRMVLD